MNGDITVADAQRDVRTTFLGGFPGQMVSGALWLLSAGLTTWVSPRSGVIALIVGGTFIFPMTQGMLRLMGRPTLLQPGNPMKDLAVQAALVTALIPLVGAATLHRLEWFYPAMTMVVGAHYFPFAFLYGLRMFLVLGGIMCAVALAVGSSAPAIGIGVGWFTGAVLIIFAFIGRRIADAADVLPTASAA